MKNHKCKDNCGTNCINRRRRVECDSHCSSGNKCRNRESQQVQKCEEFLELRFVSRQKGASVFTKEFIPDNKYVGQVTGGPDRRRIQNPKEDPGEQQLYVCDETDPG